MKTVLLGVIASTVLATGPTIAADLPLKAPPMVGFSWIGCYIGINGGWLDSRSEISETLAGNFLASGNIFAVPPARGSLDRSYSQSRSTGTVGATSGCNLVQSGNWLWGIESDFNWAGRQNTTAAFGITDVPGQALDASSSVHNVRTELWYSTFRGRVGFTSGQWYAYGTGGAAFGRVRSTARILYAADAFFLSTDDFQGSTTNSRVGWAAGGGLEYAFGNNWSFKAEYLHVDLDTISYRTICVAGATGCGPASGFATDVSVRLRENIVRVGLNYRWGGWN
jgi:outer membrane immunogenic protein